MKSCSNKTCTNVNPQSLSNFSRNNRSKDGFCYQCKTCANNYGTNNPEKVKAKNKRWRAANPNNRKNYELKKSYGITLEQYNNMLTEQKYRCAICHKTQDELGQTLSVDHCHATGKVRGLLCDSCNRGIGVFKDSVHLLANAIQYLNN